MMEDAPSACKVINNVDGTNLTILSQFSVEQWSYEE